MYEYEHGGDIYSVAAAKFKADFSSNINPLGLSATVRRALKKATGNCVHYPDPFCRELRRALAAYLKQPETNIFFGNGAADLFFRLALTIKPQRALLLAPTFADYEKSLLAVNCQITYYDLQEKYAFNIREDILSQITDGIDAVYLCNPNNPTGQLTEKALLQEILEKCHAVGAYLLVDECFLDFIADPEAYSLTALLAKHPQLIIIKAFTKTFALPGVRLGYCLNSDPTLQEALYRHGQDWSVSVLAQAAGLAALEETAYLAKARQLVAKERSYLIQQLTNLGAQVYGSAANYVFFRLIGPPDLRQRLEAQGFLLRSCANYRNLDGSYYRIAVKRHYLNSKLISAIKDITKCAPYYY